MKLYYLASPEEVLDEGEGLDVVENFLNLGGAPVGGGGVVSGQGRPSASQT